MGLRSAEKSPIYKLPYEKVFEEVKNALNDCKFKIKEIDEKSGRIKASSGASIWSWGERVEVLVSKTGGGTKVDVYSRAKAQLVDWGKSGRNVTNFLAALNKRLGE